MTKQVASKIRESLCDLMDGGDISDGYLGFCIACGAEREGCEPDARNYECEECGACQVFGAEECLMMGIV